MRSGTLFDWVVTADFKEDRLGHPFNVAELLASTPEAEYPLV